MDIFDSFQKLAPSRDKAEVRRLLIGLTERYSEPHRHYHTWAHIERGLAEYAAMFDKPLSAVQFFAWMYHDAVYDPQKHDNEERSALVFLQDREALGFDIEKADEVMTLIRSTEPSIIGTSVINDMDLCILGTDLKDYFEYVKAVRKEYSFVNEELWTNGRAAVLKSFLKRHNLYVTTEFAAKFTHNAQRNMQAELDYLISQQ